jgi:hypothetical protein
MAEDLSGHPVQGLQDYQQGQVAIQQSLANVALAEQHIQGVKLDNQAKELQAGLQKQQQEQLAALAKKREAEDSRDGMESNAGDIFSSRAKELTDIAHVYEATGDTIHAAKILNEAANLQVKGEQLKNAKATRDVQKSKLYMEALKEAETIMERATPQNAQQIKPAIEALFKRLGEEVPPGLEAMLGTTVSIAALKGAIPSAYQKEHLKIQQHEETLRDAKRQEEAEKHKVDLERIKTQQEAEKERTKKLEAVNGKQAVTDIEPIVKRYYPDVKDPVKRHEIAQQLVDAIKTVSAHNRTIDPNSVKAQDMAAALVRESRLREGKDLFPATQEDWIRRMKIQYPDYTRDEIVAFGRKNGKVQSDAAR